MNAPETALSVTAVRRLARRIAERTTGSGMPSADVRLELETLDRDATFTPGARAAFQDLLARLGIATVHAIRLPLDDEPFWFRGGHPLADHQSRPQLPEAADIVVIGAGLTGASAAYHLAESVTEQRRIVVLDQGDPAGEASGRNGGNFELIPENSVGMYEGLARERHAFLRRSYPKLPIEVVQAESERQASLVLGLALRNRELFKGIILHERIDCDFAPRGWMHLASTEEEEQGMCEEVTLAAQHGQRIELWSRRKIRLEFGFENPYLGRFIPGDGTYHPFKYVCGLLRCAIRAGVELYARTAGRELVSFGGQQLVVTDRGTIAARAVIVATNAFTSQLLPELSQIKPYQSQVQVTEHAPDRARGRVITCEDGPTFFNQPRATARNGRAPLLMGGGADRAMSNPSSRRRSPRVHQQLLALRDRFYPELRGCPPSAEWVGPMAFTPDQLPAIGFLRPGVVIAAGYNGYGGSYTTAAGMAAAQMARMGCTPDWVPEDVFSPRRLTRAEPIFMTERDSLWRIAAALCRQLKYVNRQISEALTLSTGEAASAVPRHVPPRVSRMLRVGDLAPEPATSIAPEMLAAFPAFRDFTLDELRTLLESMQRRDMAHGTLLFMEGDPGSTCYVLVRGAVDVSVKVRGQPQLLAQLSPGAIFGQASLIENEPRSTSCSIHRDALLAEIHPDACERLLASGSPLALKLLSALNQGLVAALRAAGRNLMRLDARRDGDSPVPMMDLS
ncbi:MAG: FAD-dependent oxidoreductase [Gemmatimonadaceae bacterium]|nr:FAD-dependent oxidoreductase [Gemmatimonadaceae bacterium]